VTLVSPEEFVVAHTQVRRPAFVPEVRLRLADDIDALWQLVGTDTPPPYWAFAWLGGQALARYVLDRPEEVAGRRVLDLATGSGLVALAAVAAGAAEVTAVDIDPYSAAAVALNARLNGATLRFVAGDLLAAEPPAVDVVLLGDVCYEQEMTRRVLGWLVRSQARVLLGDPGRSYLPQQGLVTLASYDIPTTRELEGVELKRVRVFTPAPGRS
jgi:predicted nicotinamide N-methyase